MVTLNSKVKMNYVKVANPKTILDKLQNMLHHFNTYNFIKFNENKSIEFDFNIENLKEAVKREWLFQNLVCCEQPAFQFKLLNYDDDLKSALDSVKSLATTIPFTLIEVGSVSDRKDNKKLIPRNAVDVVSNQFKNRTGTILKSQTLCSPSTALDFFHKQQRERKIWWRKFSALPGRFHITEMSSDKRKSQFVEIQAEFPWGFETVEVIRYLPEIFMTNNNSFSETANQQKFLPQIVSCESILENITFTYLCDSYEGINEDTDRDMLRFSRKLAPYKVAIAASGNSTETRETLKDLALLLAQKIRQNGFPVLLLPDMSDIDINTQVLRNDCLGVPYTLLLNERTLADGILGIRSRDTTLTEDSHVSLVESYIEKLMKSY